MTDAVALPDGRVLVSAAAEDTPDPVDDGPVVAAALALLDEDRVTAMTALPERGVAVQFSGPRPGAGRRAAKALAQKSSRMTVTTLEFTLRGDRRELCRAARRL